MKSEPSDVKSNWVNGPFLFLSCLLSIYCPSIQNIHGSNAALAQEAAGGENEPSRSGAGKSAVCRTHGELNVLFIGNSLTGHCDVPAVFKGVSESKNSELRVALKSIVYGGTYLDEQWNLYHSMNWIREHEITADETHESIVQINEAKRIYLSKTYKHPKTKGTYQHHFERCLRYQNELLEEIETDGRRWDIVVLQIMARTREEEYVRKFAKLVNESGARCIIYAPEFYRLNAAALTTTPDAHYIKRSHAFDERLAKEIHAVIAPVYYAVYLCQVKDPEFTSRWENDPHPNQECTYLAACVLYGTIFKDSPVGIAYDQVCFPHRPKYDPDGRPRCQTIADPLKSFLQETAWEAVNTFHDID